MKYFYSVTGGSGDALFEKIYSTYELCDFKDSGGNGYILRNKVLIFLIFLLESRNINILSLSDFIRKLSMAVF